MSARGWMTIRMALTVIVVAGLAVDAFVHFDVASGYQQVKSSTLTESALFRAEGIVALIAAAALLLRPRRYTAAFAFLVTAGGTFAVLLYYYVNVGAFGPLPNMYEHVWYTEKTLSVWAEGFAAVAALALLVVMHAQRRRTADQAVPRGATLVQLTG